MMRSATDWKRRSALVSGLVVLGVAVGLSSGLLSVMLKWVEQLTLGFVESPQTPGPSSVAPSRRILAVVLGAIFAAAVWWWLRNRTAAVPSVKQAVAGEHMPFVQTTVHVLLQILIVGSGSSVGREVAPREFGALLGQRVSAALHVDKRGTEVIVACAAAAGLAGVYNAPMAGTMFAVEILLTEMTGRVVALALGLSAISAFVASLVRGQETFYQVLLPSMGNPGWAMIGFAVVCGLCCGVLGAAFRKASGWAQRHRAAGAPILWCMPLAALLTGVVALWLPQVMGNGRAAAQLAFSTMTPTARAQWTGVGVLLAVGLAKAALTVLTIRSGASGGVLQPGIALGAVCGALLGVVTLSLMPGLSAGLTVGACALVGASSLLAASQQAPLMAMFLVMELTGVPVSYMVPLGLGAACAWCAAKLVH